jgi:hypothetical protein
MQLFVASRYGNDWRVDAMLNARRVTLEQQSLADAFDALPPEARRRAEQHVVALQPAS